MSNKRNKLKHKLGKPPGTFIYMGDKKVDSAIITFTEYDERTVVSKKN